MSVFSSFSINASGLASERFRMDTISQNVANATTTRTEDGTPYKRKIVTFQERGQDVPFNAVLARRRDSGVGNGVRVDGVHEDTTTPMNMVYDPSHPDADDNGYVTYPNVNIITEMTNLIDSSRAYEANVTAFNTSKAIAMKGLEIGKGV